LYIRHNIQINIVLQSRRRRRRRRSNFGKMKEMKLFFKEPEGERKEMKLFFEGSERKRNEKLIGGQDAV
jgi:hypothetical protein